MEVGMADYTHAAYVGGGTIYIQTRAEYNLYCYYSAGLVAEGLARLVSASGKEASWVGSQLELSNSVGLLLQKTNTLRDYREDVEEGRFYWPKEIWGSKSYGFNEMREMYEAIEADGGSGTSEKARKALYVQSEMILDALQHAMDALDCLTMSRNPNVCRAMAVPTTMAMATLELCFMNREMFLGNIKIRKAEAARVGVFSVVSRCFVSVLDSLMHLLYSIVVHARKQCARRRTHRLRLCAQDTCKSTRLRPEFPQNLNCLRKGSLIQSYFLKFLITSHSDRAMAGT
jgi:farnesyl-diphosphate farnesyltransferase